MLFISDSMSERHQHLTTNGRMYRIRILLRKGVFPHWIFNLINRSGGFRTTADLYCAEAVE